MSEGLSGPKSAVRYSAFISYRHQQLDRKGAAWLHGALETFRVPRSLARERGVPQRLNHVFRDEEELKASPNLSASIEEALVRSDHLIVVCSPSPPASQWINAEVERFIALGRASHISALLVEGEPAKRFRRRCGPLRLFRGVRETHGSRVAV